MLLTYLANFDPFRHRVSHVLGILGPGRRHGQDVTYDFDPAFPLL